MEDALISFLPQDRRAALASGRELSERVSGTALFADLVGFTALADAMAAELGPRRGAEELIAYLGTLYDAMIPLIEQHGGSVIGFLGDALLCWFDGGPAAQAGPAGQAAALRAAACGLALPGAIAPLATTARHSMAVRLKISVGLVSGPARRLLVGDPQIQRLDVLAGSIVDRLMRAESLAAAGSVVADRQTADLLGVLLLGAAPTPDPAFAAIVGLAAAPDLALAVAAPPPSSPLDLRLAAPGLAPAAAAPPPPLDLRPWIQPAVYERLRSGAGALAAEIRPVTALMLAFGGLDYDRDEQAGALLDAYIAWVQQTVARHQGCLIDVTPGQPAGYLYAAFGAPTAHGDESAQALAAALALRSPPPALAAVGPVAIGIAQGQVRAGVIGGGGRSTYAVLGDPANLAFRLMGLAGPGGIRCDETVYTMTRRRWAFTALPPIKLKGKPEPVSTYAPSGDTAAPGVAVAGAAPTIVGRAAELRHLEEVVESVGAGASRVIILEGEAGVGKSRLLGELGALLQARGLTLLLGGGTSVGQQTPYRAWRPIVADLAGFPGGAGPGARAAQLDGAGFRTELRERLPLLNDLLDLDLAETDLTEGLDPAARAESLGGLVIALLRERARAGPVVIALEDAHWLDSRSWALAERLARSLATAPVAVLLALTLRPLEAEHPAIRTLAGLLSLPGVTRLTVSPLADDALPGLIAAHLGVAPGGLDPALVTLLRERAAGNPLFAEELLSALDERGLLVRDDGRIALRGELEAARSLLPDTLQGLLLSRIDRLAPAEQLTLKVAAVLGPVFSFRPLHYVRDRESAIEGPALHQQLRALAARDFTWLERPEPDLAYRFRHVLSQEAAYQTLLYAQRRALHRAAAEWYEAQSPEPPLLAHHYRYAEDRERERHYARLAGVGAADRYANQEAVAFFTRALELTPPSDLAGRFDLLQAREGVHDLVGDREAQRQAIEALGALAETMADDERRALVALRRSRYADRMSDYPAMAEAARSAVALAADASGQRLAATIELGIALSRMGQVTEARQVLSHGIEQARVIADRDHEARLQLTLGNSAYFEGDLATGREAYTAAIEIYHEIGDQQGEASARSNLAVILGESGDLAEGRRYQEQALALRLSIGDRLGSAISSVNLASVTFDLGDYSAARSFLAQALPLFRELSNRYGEGIVLGNMGDVAAALGDSERARECYTRALAINVELGDPRGQALVLVHLTLIEARHGAPIAGQEAAERALDLARQAGARPVEAQALAARAEVALVSGDLAAAESYYLASLEIQRDIGRHRAALRTVAGLAATAAARGDTAGALAHVEPILEHLEHETLDGVESPGRVYLICVQTLQAAGDPRAGALLARAQADLRERSMRIDDEAARRSFLERVPANRELLTAYASPPSTSSR